MSSRESEYQGLEADLPRLTAPTLLVWGKEDRITPVEVAERFRALIPHAEIVYLPNCGHAPMLEHPAIFGEIVHDWLRDTVSRRTSTTPVAGGTR